MPLTLNGVSFTRLRVARLDKGRGTPEAPGGDICNLVDPMKGLHVNVMGWSDQAGRLATKLTTGC